MVSCPPSGDPIAHGEPGSPGCGVSVLLRPLRKVKPIGCTGGRYTTSKPIAAIPSSRLAAVRSVPETGGLRPAGSNWTPSDRGKNSYHEPYSARSLSTCTASEVDLVSRSRSGQAARTEATAGCSAAASRSAGVSPGSRIIAISARSAARAAALRLAPSGCGIRRTARSNSSAPSVSTNSTSWPAGILIAASWCQLAIGSAHASTWKRHRPSLVTVTSAPYRSVPGASSRISVTGPRLRPGSRRTTPVPMTPCPSRNTVALTAKVSPVTAFAGRRPSSTTGSRSRIGIRPITPITLPRTVRIMPARGPVNSAAGRPRSRAGDAGESPPLVRQK